MNPVYTITHQNIVNNQKQTLEKDTVVYFLLRNQQIVYVGQACNFYGRIREHLRQKSFDSFAYVSPQGEKANDVEAFYIVKFNPVYNINLPKNRFYVGLSAYGKSLGITYQAMKALLDIIGIKPVWKDAYSKDELDSKRDLMIETIKKIQSSTIRNKWKSARKIALGED